MSIVAYTGLPGSGKSYSVVEHQIIPALVKGRTVVTNLPLRKEGVDEYMAKQGVQCPGRVVDFPVDVVAAEPHRIREFVTAGSIFVLDEAWRLFPQGQQANKVAPEFASLLAEHRHMVDEQGNSTQLVFVVQDLANIAAFARRLVENTFVTTKLGFVGLTGSFRVDVFHGGQQGATPPVSSRLRFITGRYRKEIFALYKSHTMATDDAFAGANEQKIDGRANILKRPAFVIGAIACPLLIAYSLHAFAKAFHGGLGPRVTPKAAAPPEAPARSGAEHGRADGTAAIGVAPVFGNIRVIMDVVQADGTSETYVGDGHRVFKLGASECRRVEGAEVQCLFRGAYYDTYGRVEGQASQPVAAYSSATAKR